MGMWVARVAWCETGYLAVDWEILYRITRKRRMRAKAANNIRQSYLRLMRNGILSGQVLTNQDLARL